MTMQKDGLGLLIFSKMEKSQEIKNDTRVEVWFQRASDLNVDANNF